MTFTAPAMLWWLLAALPLIALFIIRVRPRRRTTVAWFLWEGVVAERRHNALWKRLRDLWSLLLLLVALIAAVLALAEPRTDDREQRDVLLVLDTSLSMQATVDGDSRFERARDVAAAVIDTLDGNRRVALASADIALHHHAARTTDGRSLREQLATIEPSDTGLDAQVARELQALADLGDGLDVVFISDRQGLHVVRSAAASPTGSTEGSADSPSAGENPRGSLSVHVVGDEREVPANLGLVAADLRRLDGGDRRAGLYLQVASSAADSRSVEIHLAQGRPDNVVALHQLTVPAQGIADISRVIEDAEAGLWYASLGTSETADAVESDQRVPLVLRDRVPLAVAVLAQQPYFIEAAARSFAHQGGPFRLQPDPITADLVVAQGRSSESRLNVIMQPDGDSPWWQEPGAALERPAPVVVLPEHPALRHLSPGLLGFAGARELQAPPGSVVLVQDVDGTPLLYLASVDGRRAAVVNLDPHADDFVLQAAFPILLHGLAADLAGLQPLPPAVTAADQPLPVDRIHSTVADAGSPADAKDWRVHGPRSVEWSLSEARHRPVRRAGLYRLSGPGGSASISVASLDVEESRLQGADSSTVAPAIAAAWMPAWWLLVIAAGVLLLEHWWYHRRVVG